MEKVLHQIFIKVYDRLIRLLKYLENNYFEIDVLFEKHK
jgi:hypothetical protein